MLDIGWTEIAIISVIALVVVGPKDLPGLVRTIGRWSGKARKYSRDFTRKFEEIADQNELAEVRKELEEANRELAAAGRVEEAATGKIAGAAEPASKANGGSRPDSGNGGTSPGEKDPSAKAAEDSSVKAAEDSSVESGIAPPATEPAAPAAPDTQAAPPKT